MRFVTNSAVLKGLVAIVAVFVVVIGGCGQPGERQTESSETASIPEHFVAWA